MATAIQELKALTGQSTSAKTEGKSKTPAGNSSKFYSPKLYTLEQIKALRPENLSFDRLHEYTAGNPVYVKAIYKDDAGKKTCKFFTLSNKTQGLYVMGRKSEPVLYNEELLLKKPDDVVLVVEGEKDAAVLTDYGFLAVTAGSSSDLMSKTVLDLFKAHLRGREVILIPDEDEPGQKAMQAVSKALTGAVASARIIDIGGAWNSLIEDKEAMPKGADISDLIESYQRCFPLTDPES
ncbi:MAG: toprim domain-containing protein [Nitrospirae bacterium]|nr:toprim domain-containing protein [Nitrospirota bacterium]